MKIAFFGASVTQQKTGYVFELCKLNTNNYQIHKFGYGGMHISDASVVFINNVIKVNPDICFIDWFSTGWIESNDDLVKKYIDNMLLKLTEIKCKVVFLFLPRTPFELNRLSMFETAHKILDSYDIKYIDIYKNYPKILEDNFNLVENDTLRDNIHTTEKGSIEYAKIINDWLSKNINNLTFPNKEINKSILYNIKKYQLSHEIRVQNKLTIEGNCDLLFFYIRKGPNAGKIKLNDKVKNIWDQWCYYERNDMFEVDKFKEKLEVTILNDDFNRDTCKVNLNWNKYKKELVILDIYFNGEISKVYYS